MKILYYTDNYTYGNYGTKRSIFEEVKKRGHNIIWINKEKINEVLDEIKKNNPDQIWLAHSNLIIKPEIKDKIKIPVIGFGFSDPYIFKKTRLQNYDKYITNHYETYNKCSNIIPIMYNPTACDFNFHQNLSLKKNIDISAIGVGIHPHFNNKKERVEIINKLRAETNFLIHTYGDNWGKHGNNFGYISGSAFLNIINSSKIGLDIQDNFCPMAHRMFEYAACKIPVITREREEVFKFFKKDKEILTYNTYQELKEKLNYYLNNEKELEIVGINAYNRCKKEHNINHRVDKILKFLH